MVLQLGALTCAFSEVKELSATLETLYFHLDGSGELDESELREQATRIQENLSFIGDSEAAVLAALELVALYDKKEGAWFLNERTRGGVARASLTDLGLDHALFLIQQGLIDFAYTPENVESLWQVLDEKRFATSEYFPGTVSPPENRSTSHKRKINASQPASWGYPVAGNEEPARRPTGCYLAPGSVSAVRVPPELVGKGYAIRVGAHSWDLAKKPKILRLDRVSLVYPITQQQTFIANPLGGGIYIEVPYQADAGIVEIEIFNALRSPMFSARSFDPTSLSDWKKTERKHPGPWADFESDKFMMQVPTDWISKLDDPVTLMADWDKAMDGVSELLGLPLVRPKSILYIQTDVTMRGSANFPGYPQSNYAYDPLKGEGGKASHWMVRGPQYSDWTVFHEVGHAQSLTKFKGEVEAVVNLPYVAVMNRKFDTDLDLAFGNAISQMEAVSLDQAATMWMVTENFRNGNPMNISNRPGDEVKYQHRGFGKYVEIASLFGWDALSRFWHSVSEDYEKGIIYPKNDDPIDSRILRMSRAADVDLTPLIHFWGVQPDDSDQLAKDIRREGLNPSRKIYDRLVYYQSIIPMSSGAFKKHTETIYPKGPNRMANPAYGEGWYAIWVKQYDDSHGAAARDSLQEIIDHYFPSGAPAVY